MWRNCPHIRCIFSYELLILAGMTFEKPTNNRHTFTTFPFRSAQQERTKYPLVRTRGSALRGPPICRKLEQTNPPMDTYRRWSHDWRIWLWWPSDWCLCLPLGFEHVQLIPSLSQDMGHMGALGTLYSQFHLRLTTLCLQNLVQHQFSSSSFMIHVHSLLPCKFPFWGDSIARGVLGSPFHQITSQKSRLEGGGINTK